MLQRFRDSAEGRRHTPRGERLQCRDEVDGCGGGSGDLAGSNGEPQLAAREGEVADLLSVRAERRLPGLGCRV